MEPMTRGSSVPSECLRTSVYRPSWDVRTSRIFASWGMTPTPQMPQSKARPLPMRRSRYMAWWALWKLPKPKWTIPVLSFERSYAGA